MNKAKITSSLITLTAATSLLVGSTAAFFSDSGTSSNNLFSTGTLDLQLANGLGDFSDNVTATFGIANGGPGSTFSGDLMVKNTGSTPAAHLDIQVVNAVDDADSGPGLEAGTPMDKVIQLTALGWDTDGNGSTDQNLLPLVTDENGNGIADLDDLENLVANDIIDLNFNGVQTDSHLLHVDGNYSSTLMGNQHQGDTVTTTLTLTLTQD